ncbi:unnamed protein product [Rhizophagus irregularis]|nr:unnamed protein product [Rhizophagus irregularis]
MVIWVMTELECPSINDELFASTSSSDMKTTLKPKDKQKARVTNDKQVKNQSTTANPGAQTSAKKLHRGKKLSVLEASQILTGYKEANDQREQVRDIIVYNILYTWDIDKILGELTYFENWEATLKALDNLQVFIIKDKELKWCQYSVPTLKKQHKLKAKNTLNKKSGNTGQSSNSNQPKKKDKKSLTKAAKDDNQLKNPNSQKKAKKSSKSKSNNKGNEGILAKILTLLRKLN